MVRVTHSYRMATTDLNLGQLVEELRDVPGFISDNTARYRVQHDGNQTLKVTCLDTVNKSAIDAIVAAHVPDPSFGREPTLAEWMALPEAVWKEELYDLLHGVPPEIGA